MLSTRFTGCLAAVLLLAAGSSALHGQAATGVDAPSARISLPGGLSARVASLAGTAQELTVVDSAQPLPDLMLQFAMSPAKRAALDQLVAAQQDPTSSEYHRWLTPEQFRTRFGVDGTQESAVLQWLSAQGFTVKEISRGGLFVRFSGTVGQAQQAFGASIHRVIVQGESHTANTKALSVPSVFANVIAGIHGLDDFRPRSHGTTRTVASSSAGPLFTTASGTHYLAPGDVNSIYGKTALPSSVTGLGVTIAVVGQSDINLSDIAAFQTAAGLPLKAPSVTTYGSDPGSPAADLAEAEMDLEWAGAIAPGANILYVNSNDAIAGS
ncbi:MAG: protease pro-enzyme activation domain-containing protein, partial [Bryocella sp.]